MEITRAMAEESWRENPPDDRYAAMMRDGGEYRVPLRSPVSAFVGGHLMDIIPVEPIPVPYVRFTVRRIRPDRIGVIAEGKWIVATGPYHP